MTQPRKHVGPSQPDSAALDAGLVEELLGALFTISQGGQILTWNAGAESLYGYSAEEIIGSSFLETIVPLQELEPIRGWLTSAFDAANGRGPRRG